MPGGGKLVQCTTYDLQRTYSVLRTYVDEARRSKTTFRTMGRCLLKIVIIIIIIFKKDRQCKAEREWYTPYQSEDPSPTIPTYRQKEEKGKKSRRL